MLFRIKALLVILTVALVMGCSDKQEEASELEQAMLAQDSVDTAADTMTAAVEPEIDSAAMDAMAVPEEPSRSWPTGPSGSGYTLQVAGCEDQDYAYHLVSVYEGRGYEPYVVTAVVDGQTYYRVRLGRFDTLAEVRALKAQILDRFSVDGWIDYVDE